MSDDWRLPGASEFLLSAEFRRKTYEPSEGNDHDHCGFCWRKFMEATDLQSEPDALAVGYAALDRPQGRDDYYWVCEECFDDFRGRFEWTVVAAEG